MYLNVHAIVLRAERAGERDKRLSLFTREKGRLPAAAAGAAKPRARLAAATEPGVESHFRLWAAPGRSVARVAGGALAAGFPRLRLDWARHTAALSLCEWTDRLTPLEQPHPEKYDLLRGALEALQTEDPDAVRLAFLVQFLDQAGYYVGADVLGASVYARWRERLPALRAYAFSGPAPEVREPDALEESLVHFVSPLLARPLRTLAYRNQLKKYIALSAQPSALRKAPMATER
jgi:hypothetical protein